MWSAQAVQNLQPRFRGQAGQLVGPRAEAADQRQQRDQD
jgi:hypothetical protein